MIPASSLYYISPIHVMSDGEKRILLSTRTALALAAPPSCMCPAVCYITTHNVGTYYRNILPSRKPHYSGSSHDQRGAKCPGLRHRSRTVDFKPADLIKPQTLHGDRDFLYLPGRRTDYSSRERRTLMAARHGCRAVSYLVQYTAFDISHKDC